LLLGFQKCKSKEKRFEASSRRGIKSRAIIIIFALQQKFR